MNSNIEYKITRRLHPPVPLLPFRTMMHRDRRIKHLVRACQRVCIQSYDRSIGFVLQNRIPYFIPILINWDGRLRNSMLSFEVECMLKPTFIAEIDNKLTSGRIVSQSTHVLALECTRIISTTNAARKQSATKDYLLQTRLGIVC